MHKLQVYNIQKMKNLIKPQKLNRGDKVAAVTLSWGGPGKYPYRYYIGKKIIEEKLGIEVVEMKHTLASPQWIYRNPEARAEDLMNAFLDQSIKGIFSTIGGDDCSRILKFLDLKIIGNNPKVFLGYSDSTAIHMACYKAGLISFFGPSIMAQFAENVAPFRYTLESVKRVLFESSTIGGIQNSERWTDDYLDWANEKNQNTHRKMHRSSGWKWIQGKFPTTGQLLGGTLDVLEFLKGTTFFPSIEDWSNTIFYLEAASEKHNQYQLERWLRNYGVQGIFDVVNAIIVGRSAGLNESKLLERAIRKVVVEEFGKKNIPIVINLDFGHTDPMFTIANGIKATINPQSKKLTIDENSVQ